MQHQGWLDWSRMASSQVFWLGGTLQAPLLRGGGSARPHAHSHSSVREGGRHVHQMRVAQDGLDRSQEREATLPQQKNIAASTMPMWELIMPCIRSSCLSGMSPKMSLTMPYEVDLRFNKLIRVVKGFRILRQSLNFIGPSWIRPRRFHL